MGRRFSFSFYVFEIVFVPERFFFLLDNLGNTTAFETSEILMNLFHVVIAHSDLLSEGSRRGRSCCIFVPVFFLDSHIGPDLGPDHLCILFLRSVSFNELIFPIEMLCFGHLILLDLLSELSGVIVFFGVVPCKISHFSVSFFLLRSHYLIVLFLMLLYIVEIHQFLFFHCYFQFFLLSFFLHFNSLVFGV